MDKALAVINELERDGVIRKYAIGGAIGAMFYVEAVATFDLDVFCFLKNTGLLIDLGPIYRALADKGYSSVVEEQVLIEGVPVQFIVPIGLEEEAVERAQQHTFMGVPVRVFSYEHLLAIMVKTGRAKDKARIALCLESRQPDSYALKDILSRYNLIDKWDSVTRD
ncbi:hypothetical protein KF707_09560 [Candidatus Obscuribacterales bacterium]|jgi:hypothetical protein|nr:hypothetical protein [Candidatus Obscuribacterales bacterium]MBX3136471.1 hypothetical protein [Candidatus Obscuribacterales bacterium]